MVKGRADLREIIHPHPSHILDWAQFELAVIRKVGGIDLRSAMRLCVCSK